GCTFTRNLFGGIRLKAGDVEITGCLIKGMDVGIRYWQGSPSINHNTITDNKTGIFCRQGGAGSSINFNNICSNSEYGMKLGDAQTEDLDATRNWWGTSDIAAIKARVYDKGREEYIGRVLIEPVLKSEVGIK
ncbi:MAG: right-handed parallel beta-helix repeat-containing protein, partial [Nitrospirota bacterium]